MTGIQRDDPDNTRFVSRALMNTCPPVRRLHEILARALTAGEKINKSADLKCIIIRERASDYRIVIVRVIDAFTIAIVSWIL